MYASRDGSCEMAHPLQAHLSPCCWPMGYEGLCIVTHFEILLFLSTFMQCSIIRDPFYCMQTKQRPGLFAVREPQRPTHAHSLIGTLLFGKQSCNVQTLKIKPVL